MQAQVLRTSHLREWRTKFGLSQTALARRGVSRPTIISMERGGSVYKSSVRRIAAALGITPDQLMLAPK